MRTATGRMFAENPGIVIISCLLAILGVMGMRMVLKLDIQTFALAYVAAAATAAVRWTPMGAGVSIFSLIRAVCCLAIGLVIISLAGYPGVTSFHTASLLPQEIVEALGVFGRLYNR